ncbi:MAG: hypothetical protein ACI8PT_004609 [Gammaproteobacteria bacterium]|jgi:hypothetical protein
MTPGMARRNETIVPEISMRLPRCAYGDWLRLVRLALGLPKELVRAALALKSPPRFRGWVPRHLEFGVHGS